MDEQLRMVDTDPAAGEPRARTRRRTTPASSRSNPWDIDDHTREVGIQGLQQAREALHRASTRTAA